jgi:hypothetical protein
VINKKLLIFKFLKHCWLAMKRKETHRFIALSPAMKPGCITTHQRQRGPVRSGEVRVTNVW